MRFEAAAVCWWLRVLPIIAVQVAPAEAAPALEQQLLSACSAGLSRARCVSAQEVGEERPRGIAMVSWVGAAHASIEVGMGNGGEPIWVSRELDFAAADPVAERWRAVGLTIALLADDPRFWAAPEPEPAPPVAAEPSPVVAVEPVVEDRPGPRLELRGLTGAGVVSGPWRWGAELRLAVPLSSAFFLTGSVDYALANSDSLDVRWFDATLGVGVFAGSPFANIDARVRLELLVENIAGTARYEGVTGRTNTWVPGVSLGGDLLWPLGGVWGLSARADVFLVEGSTVFESVGQRAGVSAGAGVLLGLGASCQF